MQEYWASAGPRAQRYSTVLNVFLWLCNVCNFMRKSSSQQKIPLSLLYYKQEWMLIQKHSQYCFRFLRKIFGHLLLLHTFSYKIHSNVKMFSSLRTFVLVFNFSPPFTVFKILSFLHWKSMEQSLNPLQASPTSKCYCSHILSPTDGIPTLNHSQNLQL